ncbi:sensor histidine kinase, partial [bacterium]
SASTHPRRLIMWTSGVPSARTQHLVFLAHVWACAPFMIAWTGDPQIHEKLGDPAVIALRPFVLAILAYLLIRTWLAWKNPPWLKWHYVFPPLDVLIVSILLAISHRGPLSSLTMLYFFAIIEAAASLSVRWAASIGVLVVVGTILATLKAPYIPANSLEPTHMSLRELLEADTVNVAFRVYFMIVLASLMTFQARIAAEYRSEARLAEDRNRLALDVHDGVQGSLIAVASGLELIARLAEREPERVPALANDVRESARDAADELRFLVQRLRPPSLTGGFLPAIKQYSHALAGRHGLELVFEVQGEAPRISPDVEQAVFCMLREALNNVAKHAEATRVCIDLIFTKGSLQFSVEDDGRGLQDAAEGTGRAGMRERTAALGGSLTVTDAERGGTLVRAQIPL